jgi:hypothetical protein
LLKGGDSGPAIVAGKPGESLLLKALRHDASVSAMPPKEKLSSAEIGDFEAWIAAGAVDPREGSAVAVKRGLSIEEGRQFWSFIPPQRTVPRITSRTDWAFDDIDRFVLAKLEEQSLKPLGDTEPHLLLRRLSFDLLGLPPSPEEVAEFVNGWNGANDEAEKQRSWLAQMVDQLLARRQFGERCGVPHAECRSTCASTSLRLPSTDSFPSARESNPNSSSAPVPVAPRDSSN